jgi:hypothetical protein
MNSISPTLTTFLFILSGILSPVWASDSDIQKVYRDALKAETQAFNDFREVRAVDAATALKIPLDKAKERVNVPGPSRKEIDTSILQKSRLQAAETARQRETIRAVHAELDDMIVVTRRLLEQLREEEAALESGTDIDLESLRAEMTAAMEAAALAAEDDGARAKDMTAGMDATQTSAAAQARTDAMVAAQAAAQAARSAANAEARAQAAPADSEESRQLLAAAQTSKKEAAHSAAAAQEAAKAQASANAAARKQDGAAEAAAAAAASDAAAQAVYHALLAALAAGEIDEASAAQMAGAAAAAMTSGAGSVSATATGTNGRAPGSVGGKKAFSPDSGTTAPSNPGPTIPARGISTLGEEGPGWIRLDSWYVIGPFPNPARQNVDVSFPPESLIDLDAIHIGDGGKPVRWTFVQSAGEMVKPPEDPPYVIYYAYTEVYSDADRELWVALGSDDNSRVWLNDQLIWKSGYGLKVWRRNEGFRRVLFRRGVNRILYRVENGHGASGFSFLIQTASEVAN